MTYHFITFLLLMLLGMPAAASAQDINTDQTRMKARPFDLKAVRIKDGIYKHTFDLNYQYLLHFNTQQLLYNFRANAGIKNKVAPLRGWEAPDCELRGHFTGHFLSALSLEYSSTGDERLKHKADTLVRGLAEVQQRLGQTGYLSAFPLSFLDRLERGEQVWAPYYTLHKILAGLLDCYQYLGNRQALDIAKRMGHWLYERNRGFAHDKMQSILRTEFGGIGESLWVLYDLTKDEQYRQAANLFRDERVLTPLYNHQDRLRGLHVNTQLPKILAQARAYEIMGDPRDRSMAEYAWHEIVNARTYVTGGCSNYEYFRSDPYELADITGPNDHENCVTHNLLKLTSHLFSWDPRPEYADYYERALMNGILGTQHPRQAGTAQYYVAQRPGTFREFCQPAWSYVCCTGTGIESYSKFGDNIYFHSDSVLWINQYIASTLDWHERGLRLDQQTSYPRFDDIHFTLHLAQPTMLEVRFRIPSWADHSATVCLNGQLLEAVGTAGSYYSLRRTWRDGDKVDLNIPRGFHTWAMPDNPNRVAILYGPVVMAVSLGVQDMSDDARWGMGGDIGNEHHYGHVADVSAIVTAESDWLKHFHLAPGGHRLTFHSDSIAQPQPITLKPFYDLWGERYSLYVDVHTPKGWQQFNERYRTFGNGVYDRIDLGDKVSMYDHNFQAYSLDSGQTDGRYYVQSKGDLHFDLRIPENRPVHLKVTYHGDESHTHFGMMIDGKPMEVSAPAPHDGFFTESYTLPEALTKGKRRIAVRFFVPRKREVSVGNTTKEQTYRYMTPRIYGAEIAE